MIISPSELPIEKYHAGPTRWWSKTSLLGYKKHGAAWTKKVYIDHTHKPKSPDGSEQGLALDCALTEGMEALHARFAFKPMGMSLATKDGKAWKEAAGDREILSYDDGIILAEAIEAVKSCVLWPQIEKSLAQHTIRRDQPSLGIGLQSRPDWYNPTDGLLLDLKKTRDLDEFGKQALSIGYHTQLALGSWALAGDGVQIQDAYLIAVEWAHGARCIPFHVPHEYLIAGHREMVRLAQDVADRCTRNDWTEKSPIKELSAPHWAEAKAGIMEADHG